MKTDLLFLFLENLNVCILYHSGKLTYQIVIYKCGCKLTIV